MAGHLNVEIVSPSGKVFKGLATGVRAPGIEGSFEVLFNHAPMVAAINVGVLVVTTPNGEKIQFATSGGFVEVSDNTLTVLAETAEGAEDIDEERAKLAEERAVKKLENEPSTEERERYIRALERARNRLRVTMGAVGHK